MNVEPTASPIDEEDIANGKQAAVEGTNTWQLRITGRVQGVGFREFARREAEKLMVCGYVRNEPDGSVTVLAQHPETRILQRFIEQLHEGPPAAEIDEVFNEQIAHEQTCDKFSIK